MIYNECLKDLFELKDKGYHFVQCISADLAMGAGISLSFNKIFNEKNRILKHINKEVSIENFQHGVNSFIINDWENNIHNLVTKEFYFQKPSYLTLTNALEELKKTCIKYNIKKIAMPKIGCGLDKLDWNVVKRIIQGIFYDIDIEIIICYK